MLIKDVISTFHPFNLADDNFVTSGPQKLDKHYASLPNIVADAGNPAAFAYREFFDGEIANDHTRRAYRAAVLRFLTWCDADGLALNQIAPWHVRQHIDNLTNQRTGKSASVRTQKLHLAGIRQFFDVLVTRHAVALNPALSVKGPRLDESEGATPAISPENIQQVFASIDTSTSNGANVIGLRDRAIIGVLAYTGARCGAVSKLRLRDYYTDGTQQLLRFREKNGKVRHIPVRHDLQQFIDDYVEASGIGSDDRDSPLFRAWDGRGDWMCSERPLRGDCILRMFKRWLRDAGIPADVLTCHSFRAAVATDLLRQDVPLPDVQYLLGHSDPRTTLGYDRTRRIVTRNIVERISH